MKIIGIRLLLFVLPALWTLPAAANGAVPRAHHMVLIVGENTSYAQITPRHPAMGTTAPNDTSAFDAARRGAAQRLLARRAERLRGRPRPVPDRGCRPNPPVRRVPRMRSPSDPGLARLASHPRPHRDHLR
jgi:hypothetical protein